MFNQYTLIDDCIKIASSYDGKIFGGYLRDVVISKMTNPSRKCRFKDVDLWFKTVIDADLFIKNMKDVYDFQLIPESSIDDNIPYTFNRKQYHLFYNNIIILFDIIVCEWFPVDDFDVNFLTYSYKDNVELIECESSSFDKDNLINSINKKKMTILPSYLKKLIVKKSSDLHISRINKRFLSIGWIISYKNIYLQTPLTACWIRETFGYKLDGSNLIYIKQNMESQYPNCYIDFNETFEHKDDYKYKLDDISDCTNDLKDNLNNCIIS